MKLKFVIRNEKDEASFRKWHKCISYIVGGIWITLPASIMVILFFVITYTPDVAYYFMCWYLIAFPCLELVFAFYAWIMSEHSIGSEIWIEEDSGNVRWKGFRFSVLQMADGCWKLVRHCPALTYRWKEKLYIHAEPMPLSRVNAAMLIGEELGLLLCAAFAICLLYLSRCYWAPFLAAVPAYPIFALRTKKIVDSRRFADFSGGPQNLDIYRGSFVDGLEYEQGDAKVIELLLLPEQLWLKNPQTLFIPSDMSVLYPITLRPLGNGF